MLVTQSLRSRCSRCSHKLKHSFHNISRGILSNQWNLLVNFCLAVSELFHLSLCVFVTLFSEAFISLLLTLGTLVSVKYITFLCAQYSYIFSIMLGRKKSQYENVIDFSTALYIPLFSPHICYAHETAVLLKSQ